MLRITPQYSSATAKEYFSSADYFLDGQELLGTWGGEGAGWLGLSGVVEQKDWDALCDNLDPRSSEKLTARTNRERRVGWDFTFSVPKSVSLLYAITNDARILDAFNASVDETMRDIESELKTRVRTEGQNSDRTTGNGVWGRFTHLTSRPVDGVPDPQLHAHAFLFNSTFDHEEGRWKAAQIGEIKRDANYFNALMHNRMASRLIEMGIPIERTAESWGIGGLSESARRTFSRRTDLIEQIARARGITDAEEKAALGALTRDAKMKRFSMEELRQIWLGWLDEKGGQAIQNVRQAMRSPERRVMDRQAAEQSIAHAADHHFERHAVIPERVLLTTALLHSIGRATHTMVESAFRASGLILIDRYGRGMATSEAILAEEDRMIDFARDGRGTCAPLAPDNLLPTREWLNEDQRKALTHLCTSRDRVMVVRGAAGTGKTSLLQEAVEKIQATGKEVHAFAPSAQASRGVLREEGFENAQTVAHLLINPEAQAQLRDQVLLVDEAGLLGSRTAAQLFEIARAQNARVILVGDRYQHKSVEAGSPLALLEEEAGIRTVELQEVVRQRDQYKQAVAYMSQGRVEAGMHMLDRLKWVHEIEDPTQRYERIAAEYLQAVEAKKSILVVSPTHSEGQKTTAAIRAALQHEGKIGPDKAKVLRLTSRRLTTAQRADPAQYQTGDVVIFQRNAKGYRIGQRLTVGVDPVPLNLAERFDVFRAGLLALAEGDTIRIAAGGKSLEGKRLDNGQRYQVKEIATDGTLTLANGWHIGPSFGHLDYGYVSTSHASQGQTKDRVIVVESSESFPAASREQLYVSVSRGRTQCSIYTDDRAGLLEAVRSGNEQMSATELARYREQDLHRAAHREDLEVAYER